MNITTVLHGKPNRKGQQNIKIRIYYSGHTCYVPIGRQIDPQDFNPANGTVKNSNPRKYEIEAEIQRCLSETNKLVVQLGENARCFKPDVIRKLLEDRLADSGNDYIPSANAGSQDFYSVASSIIEELNMEGRTGYSQGYGCTISLVKKYCRGKSTETYLPFELIDYNFLKHFRLWYREKGKDISLNTHLARIRKIYNEAINQNIISREAYPFRKIKIKGKYAPVYKNLTLEQLRELYKLEGFGRDLFFITLFLCGMNLCDIVRLPYSTEIKTTRRKIERQNPEEQLRLTIQPELREILNRYSSPEKNRLFTHTYNTDHDALKYGRLNLREVIKAAGLDIPLSVTCSLWARHTWSTVLTALGVDSNTIDKGMMHVTNQVRDKYTEFPYELIDAANRKLIDAIIYDGQNETEQDVEIAEIENPYELQRLLDKHTEMKESLSDELGAIEERIREAQRRLRNMGVTIPTARPYRPRVN